MKLAVDLFGPTHIDVVGKVAVGPEHPAAASPHGGRVDMYDLPLGVHAGIGSPGTDRFDRLVRNLRQSVFNHALYTDAVTLALPAVVGRAVILDTEGNAKDCFAGAYA